MEILQLAGVPVIAGIAYIVMAIYKKLVADKKEIWTSLIPAWAALLGGVLGVIAFFATPEIIAAENVLYALLVGMASGLAATGVNQVFKQLSSVGESEDGTSGADKTDG